MRDVTVLTQILIPDAKSLPVCTLVLDSFRVGFPTAKIICSFVKNKFSDKNPRVMHKLEQKCHAQNIKLVKPHSKYPWNFYRQNYYRYATKQVVFIDGDVIFWESCEKFTFAPSTLLAGFKVPRMWNEYTQCVSVERIHPSFMWLPDTNALHEIIKRDFRNETLPLSDVWSPFHVYSKNDKTIFHDTASNLYAMVESEHFTEPHLNCYDHLHCSTDVKAFTQRCATPEAFLATHNLAVTNPSALRGLWREHVHYYARHTVPNPCDNH